MQQPDNHHLAQLNIGRIRYEVDDPRMAGFVDNLAFVNALAFMAHREDHHPDLGVHYDRCMVRYSTHDVGGLSENDFICAAKAEALNS